LLGPLFDHTLGTSEGLYAYIDSSQNRKINDTAVLISQLMPDTGVNGMCIEFFYHMYGKGIGTLTVYLQREGVQPIAMWALRGEQNDEWLQGKVGFIIASDYSILIEGKITGDDEGDIALDDISITNGNCPLYPAYAASEGTTTTIPATTTRALVKKFNLVFLRILF
jgi:hypothetical protein